MAEQWLGTEFDLDPEAEERDIEPDADIEGEPEDYFTPEEREKWENQREEQDLETYFSPTDHTAARLKRLLDRPLYRPNFHLDA